jgi:hypothetical protein
LQDIKLAIVSQRGHHGIFATHQVLASQPGFRIGVNSVAMVAANNLLHVRFALNRYHDVAARQTDERGQEET